MTGNPEVVKDPQEIGRPIISDPLQPATPANGDLRLAPPVLVITSDWTVCTQTSLKLRFSLLDWLRNILKRYRQGS